MTKKEASVLEALAQDSIPLSALESVEDVCIHMVDKEGRIVCYSKGCELVDDMKREAVIGKTDRELNEYIENESREDYVLKTGKKVMDQHVKYKTPSGKVADVISSTYPVFSEEGEVDGALCIYRDVSDYMRMAQTVNKLQNDLKKQTLKTNGTQYTFEDVKGSSVAVKECIRHGRIAAESMAPILIAGPTGTGKEVFAQSIHNDSERADFPFVAINCSAIPENLLESTLFGTVKGSFTGATDTKGLLDAAKGGTLFLDEINSMNMAMQSKLLRVLETKRYRKVGGNKELEMDVRVLSALNQDPMEAIEENRLRADLYYRLAVFAINLPGLNERKSDIPELVKAFLGTESVTMGKKLYEISDEAREVLMNHEWPGNIRELKHAITHSIYMAQRQETVLTLELLPEYLKKNLMEKKIHDKYLSNPEEAHHLKATLTRIERQIITEVLEKNSYNISRSAKELGISRQNLQYKIKLFALDFPAK